MTRRLIIASCLVAAVGGGAGATLVASTSAATAGHELCVVLAKDANHQHTQDYCVNWTGLPTH